VKLFGDSDDVAFADSLLAEKGPRGAPHAFPGKGGWPTVRYYNKETGSKGRDYEKVTKMAMCDELGPKGKIYMQKFVEKFVAVCKLEKGEPYEGCGAKEAAFHRQAVALSKERISEKILTLSALQTSLSEKKMETNAVRDAAVQVATSAHMEVIQPFHTAINDLMVVRDTAFKEAEDAYREATKPFQEKINEATKDHAKVRGDEDEKHQKAFDALVATFNAELTAAADDPAVEELQPEIAGAAWLGNQLNILQKVMASMKADPVPSDSPKAEL